MIEYQQHLDEYISEYYLTYTHLTEKEWGNKELAKNYLEKYWLTKTEYEEKWRRVQNNIFNEHSKDLADEIFLTEFELIPMLGGSIFSKEDFDILKMCMEETQDKYFVIIQNTFGQEDPTAFRMKYPSEISWEELMSGNYISTVLFEMFHNDYFVFGDSGFWGKYVANDEVVPLDILGVKEKYVSGFVNKFKDLRCDQEIIDSLPKSYKNDYIIHQKSA